MAASVPHFVPFEMRGIDTSCRFRPLTHLGHGALIAVIRMETVIDVAVEMFVAMKPRANADEDAVVQPFRSVITGRSTGIRSDVIVAVRTLGSYADVDAD